MEPRMSLQTVEITQDGDIVTLCLNRPDAANAVDLQMARDLLTAAEHCATSPGVRAVVLTGKGKMFSGGGDVPAFVTAGDGAGALILEAQEQPGTNQDRGILASDLNSDGQFKDLLYVDGGVSTGTTGHLRMQGKEVFRHAIEKLAETAHTALEKAGLTSEDVDWIVPHQANIRIIEGTAKRMQVPMERVIVTVQDHGNTSAASIPLSISVGRARGQIKPGDLIVTEAIGGGLAWGSVVLRI